MIDPYQLIIVTTYLLEDHLKIKQERTRNSGSDYIAHTAF